MPLSGQPQAPTFKGLSLVISTDHPFTLSLFHSRGPFPSREKVYSYFTMTSSEATASRAEAFVSRSQECRRWRCQMHDLLNAGSCPRFTSSLEQSRFVILSSPSIIMKTPYCRLVILHPEN